jgi:hypothetical protein
MTADYRPLVARAVASLGDAGTVQSRKDLYERVRAEHAAQLNKLTFTAAERSQERAALEAAILAVESDTMPARASSDRLGRKGSTGLLIFSMLFPGLWALDFTCMSIFWVARCPIIRRAPAAQRR